MNLLSNDGSVFNTSTIPDIIKDLPRFCILEMGKEIDYYFKPLAIMDNFQYSMAEVSIGPYTVDMPFNWYIMIGDNCSIYDKNKKIGGNLEFVPLTDICGKDFSAFVFNPLEGYVGDYYKADIKNLYQEVSWYVPVINPNQILVIPLEKKSKPKCAFFSPDPSKLPELINSVDLL